jgi:hypothetical protein
MGTYGNLGTLVVPIEVPPFYIVKGGIGNSISLFGGNLRELVALEVKGMNDSDLMQLAIQMGWKTNNAGRWWTDEFEPVQNTWTWDRVKQEIWPREV